MAEGDCSIAGFVKDKSSKKPILGARVILQDRRGIRRETTVDSDGHFEFAGLPDGHAYTVSALTFVGLETKVVPPLKDGSPVEFNIDLSQGDQTLQDDLLQLKDLSDVAGNIEKYGKILTGLIAIVTAIATIFKGTIFQGLSLAGSAVLALAVLLAALSAGATLISVLKTVAEPPASGGTSSDLKAFAQQRAAELGGARRNLKLGVSLFAGSIALAGLAPLASLVGPPLAGVFRDDVRYGIAYTLDSAGTLRGTFEARTFAPQTAVRLFATIGDTVASPQAGVLADDSGNVRLSIEVVGTPCPVATLVKTRTVKLVAQWESDAQVKHEDVVVVCPGSYVTERQEGAGT